MCDHQHGEEEHHHDHDHDVGPNFWLEYWESGEGKDSNLQKAHECLIKYSDKLLQGREKVKIFVPMCGKTYDIKWLADKGHTVVGIELSPAAVQQFYQINGLEYTESPVPSIGGKLFKCTSLDIRIYAGDFFKFSKELESNFAAVWDAGAMHSLKKDQRSEYVQVVKAVMAPGCLYLLEDMVPSCSQALVKSDVQGLFGNNLTVEELGFTKTEYEYYKEWETDGFNIFYIH